MQTPVNFAALYDEHPEYVARRRASSFEEAQIDIEVRLFKLPNLLALLAGVGEISSVLEGGCATGELIAAMPVKAGGRKVGIDISRANVEVARALRRHRLGAEFSGTWLGRTLRRATFAAATLVRPFGRRLLASNLFVVARRPAGDGAIGPPR